MPSLDDLVRAELLRSICVVARAVLGGGAASVAMLDEPSGDLVFVAAVGEGGPDLVGGRFRADTGIAGQVMRTAEPIVIADLSHEPRFARGIAIEAGSEPDAIAVAPMRHRGRVIGVLSVLDPARTPPAGTEATLVALADHAAAAIELAADVAERRPAAGG